MATTVTYKGQVLVTVDNSTKVLETSGTWCEDDFTLVDVSGGGGGISADDWVKKNGVTSVELTLSSGAMRDYLFYGSTSLQTFKADSYTGTIPSNAFRSCTALTSVKAPKATACGGNAFQGCTSLATLVLPGINGGFGTDTVRGCTSLTAVDLGAPSSIGANTFNGNSVMNVLVIRKSNNITSLGNINTFASSPFASGGAGGTLYVPNALISNYTNASNWSTIIGYTNNQIKAIEGSIYETQYADGTPIS